MKIRPRERVLPNGVKDEVNVITGVKTKKISDDVTLNGNSGWVSLVMSTNTYQMVIANYATNNNALKATANSATAKSADGDYPVVGAYKDARNILFSPSGNLFIQIEKAKVDAQTGATTEEKFKAYLNQYPVALIYQLKTPKIFMSNKIY